MGWIQQRKQCVTNECNVSFDNTTTVPSDAASTESNPRTNTDNSPKAQKGEVQQRPTPDPPQTPHTDPLADFESPDPVMEPQQEGQGQRICKPSVYVWDAMQGHWTSTGHENSPALPRGMQPPTTSATSATHRMLSLLTVGNPDIEDTNKEEGSTPLLEFAAIGVGTMGVDPESVEQAKKLDD